MISRAKRNEPVTLVRSPIIWKLESGLMVSFSSPENSVYEFLIPNSKFLIPRGGNPSTRRGMCAT